MTGIEQRLTQRPAAGEWRWARGYKAVEVKTTHTDIQIKDEHGALVLNADGSPKVHRTTTQHFQWLRAGGPKAIKGKAAVKAMRRLRHRDRSKGVRVTLGVAFQRFTERLARHNRILAQAEQAAQQAA